MGHRRKFLPVSEQAIMPLEDARNKVFFTPALSPPGTKSVPRFFSNFIHRGGIFVHENSSVDKSPRHFHSPHRPVRHRILRVNARLSSKQGDETPSRVQNWRTCVPRKPRAAVIKIFSFRFSLQCSCFFRCHLFFTFLQAAKCGLIFCYLKKQLTPCSSSFWYLHKMVVRFDVFWQNVCLVREFEMLGLVACVKANIAKSKSW